MIYTYNEETKTFGIYANFIPKALPKGYKVISEKKYKELQEEFEKASKEE